MLSPEEQQRLSLDQKHSSRVAKVHYQKIESQKVAIDGQQCMQKMIQASTERASTNENDIEFNIEKQTNPNQDVNLIEEASKLMSKASQPKSKRKLIDVKVVVDDIARNTRQKITPFSIHEDKFLKEGIEKHGKSWTTILKDPSFKFQPSRQHCTLAQRAKKLGLV